MKEFAANLVRSALPQAQVTVSDAALDGFNGVTVYSDSGKIWIITRSYNMEDVFVVSAPASDPFNTVKTRVDSVEEAVAFIVAEDNNGSAK